VTGVQTCALPIYEKIVRGALARGLPAGWIAWLRGLSIKG
jgi:hypothetical protein